MNYECLSFAEVPGTSRLLLDYLSNAPALASFYAPPSVLDRPIAQHDSVHREQLCDTLAEQNRRFGASAATLENIERIRHGSNVIVTGQQAGILGGPVLSLLKAVSAIKLASDHDAVPVFWIATTDHDLAEIDHARLLCNGKLVRIQAPLEAQTGSIVSRSVLGSDLAAEVERCMPEADPEALALIRECYHLGERTGIAFARLWAKLFSAYGLVIIDPDDASLHAIASPLYAAAASNAVQLNDKLRERDKVIEHAGYPEQVKVTESSSLLFVDVEGVRTPVRIVRSLNGEVELRAGHQRWASAAEFAGWVGEHSAAVTPNALLRPVVQDYLLPTLAYIGGPAEIAYFAQSNVLYQELLGGSTPILHRASATLVEPRIAHLLDKYHVDLKQILSMHSQVDVALTLGCRALPQTVTDDFASVRTRLRDELDSLKGSIIRTDATLEGAVNTALSKIEYQLRKLQSRTASALVRREGEISRHAEMLWNNLHPEGQLQERELSSAYFLLRQGTGFVDLLVSRLNAHCPGHQVLGC